MGFIDMDRHVYDIYSVASLIWMVEIEEII